MGSYVGGRVTSVTSVSLVVFDDGGGPYTFPPNPFQHPETAIPVAMAAAANVRALADRFIMGLLLNDIIIIPLRSREYDSMNDTDNKAKLLPLRINEILLALYCVFVFVTEILVRELFPYKYLWIAIPAVLILFLLVCPFVLRMLSKLWTGPVPEAEKKSGKFPVLQIAFFIIPLAVLLIYYYAYYPGCLSYDSYQQLSQAKDNLYNDWHPVVHTLAAFKLPLAITGGWTGSITLFQILCFSGVLGYVFNTVYKYTRLKYTIFSMAFILLNPMLGTMTMFPWKDTAFTAGALLMVSFAIRIFFTKGEWIRSPLNTAVFIITTVLTTAFRHNAILFTAPLVLAVLFYMSRKRGVIICLCIIVMSLGLRTPLYAAFGVEKAGNRQVETLGLPMTVIGASVRYTPELTDEETLEFAYKIAPKEVWEEKYVYGSFQQVKFDEKADNSVIEEYGSKKVISMMLGCFKSSPKESVKALIKLTEASYTITDEYNDAMILGNIQEATGNRALQDILIEYCYFTSCCFPFLFIRLGVMHLILLAAVLSKCSLGKLKDWKKILFILPVFIYNYGTSVLLTGNELTTRFFFYTFPLVPLLLMFMFSRTENAPD